MDVIAHQAPSENPNAGVVQILPKQFQIGVAVVGTGKCLAPVDSALGNMERNPRQDGPWAVRQDARMR